MESTNQLKERVLNLLTPFQRIELAMDLWDSVSAEQRQPQLNDAQLIELRRRITEADAGQMTGQSWPDVKQRLLPQAP